MELAFAALHQLCGPILNELDMLPGPQREALRITFGLREGTVPDRFLVGLAVLSVLAVAAEHRPLVCLVDDEQWLDRASAQVLAFVARRLGMESVGLVFAARVPTGELTGLPQLVIEGLTGQDARALLETALTGPVDIQVREEIIAEAGGNPLALLELPRGLTPRSWQAGSAFRAFSRGRRALKRLSSGGSASCPPVPAACCCSPPPSRWGNRCWCGTPRTSWGSSEPQ
jgi:hypothetical protein